MMQLRKSSKIQDKLKTKPIRKFVTFTIDDEIYAIDILTIQEIKGSTGELLITPICDAPLHIKGMIQSHDKIIPIIDLSLFYHIKSKSISKTYAIIILKINMDFIGLWVDPHLDFVELSDDQIKQPPEFFSVIEREYIEAVGLSEDQLIMILNPEKLLHHPDLKIIKEHHGR